MIFVVKENKRSVYVLPQVNLYNYIEATEAKMSHFVLHRSLQGLVKGDINNLSVCDLSHVAANE